MLDRPTRNSVLISLRIIPLQVQRCNTLPDKGGQNIKQETFEKWSESKIYEYPGGSQSASNQYLPTMKFFACKGLSSPISMPCLMPDSQ